MATKKVMVFPGAFQYVKNYGKFEGADIWVGESVKSNEQTPDIIIGHSAGGVFALKQYQATQAKFILINPPLPKKNVPSLMWSWLKFMTGEGIPFKKLVGVKKWPHSFWLMAKLVKVDVLEVIRTMPPQNVTIIRGERDTFFCDKQSLQTAKEMGIKIIEVDAGHDWNEKIAQTVDKLISAE